MSFTKVDGTITLVPSEQRQFTDVPIQIKNGKESNVFIRIISYVTNSRKSSKTFRILLFLSALKLVGTYFAAPRKNPLPSRTYTRFQDAREVPNGSDLRTGIATKPIFQNRCKCDSQNTKVPATTSSCSTCGTAERLPKARRSPVCATAISASEPTV